MAKKHDMKTPPPVPPAPAKKSFTPLLVGALIVAALAVGAAMYLRGSGAPDTQVAAIQDAASAASKAAGMNLSDPPANAKFGPHKQAVLPFLEFPAYAPPRPPEVVRAAFTFAAEHPEVLGYVPCFCGCQRMGHRGNDDCFVAARAGNGDVTAWQPHGMECQVCIDVAHKSEEMHKTGSTVGQIRDAIEAEWTPKFPVHTPTPLVPKGGS